MSATPPQHSPDAVRDRPTRFLNRCLRRLCGVLLLCLVVFGMLALPLVFTTRVVPPAEPGDPVPVYIVDYGRTAALLLPDDQGNGVAWVYGDWNYYALENRGFFNVLPAMLWPTPGTLGRLPVTGPPEPETLRRGIPFPIENLHRVTVDRAAVQRLLERLDGLYAEQREIRAVQTGRGPVFVPDPQSYTYFYNSNHRVADWLRELECAVDGPAYLSRWRIVERER